MPECIPEETSLGIDYEHLGSFCQQIIDTDRSVRWAGLVNRNGVILAQHRRTGLHLLLTEEENEEYAATAIVRQKTRGRFESKIGRMQYAFGRYEKLHRATIPVSENLYLLVTIDVEYKDFDGLIMGRIMPQIEKDRDRFAMMDGST